MFRAFEKGCTVEEAVQILLDKFEGVTVEQARTDVEAFVAQLKAESLLEKEA